MALQECGHDHGKLVETDRRPGIEARKDKGMRREILLERVIHRMGVPVELKSVQAREFKTSYLATGAGKPVLLIHGGDAGAGCLRWYPVIGPLSVRFQVIAPDLIGYGEFVQPWAAYDRPFFSHWLKDFLDALDLRRVHLVGHSVGGAIALQFALDHPEYLERLVLVNTTALDRGTQKVPASLKLRLIWQNLFPSRRASRWFLEYHGLVDPQKLDETMLDVEEYGAEVIRGPGGRRVFWLGRGRVIAPFQMEALSQIGHPTLFLWGETDPNYPPSQAGRAMGVMPDARLQLIPQAGHNSFYDQPYVFNDALIRFLLEDHLRNTTESAGEPVFVRTIQPGTTLKVG